MSQNLISIMVNSARVSSLLVRQPGLPSQLGPYLAQWRIRNIPVVCCRRANWSWKQGDVQGYENQANEARALQYVLYTHSLSLIVSAGSNRNSLKHPSSLEPVVNPNWTTSASIRAIFNRGAIYTKASAMCNLMGGFMGAEAFGDGKGSFILRDTRQLDHF